MKRFLLTMTLLIAFCVPWTHAQNFLYEGFEGGSIPSGWTQEGSGSWSVGTGDHSSSTGAYAGSYNAKRTHSTSGTATKLITPAIDCSSKSDVILTFAYINRDWDPCDNLRIYYRTSSEGSWTQVEEISSAHESWTEAEYTLPTSNSTTFQVAFEMYDRYGYGIGLDEITIVPAPDCFPLKTITSTTTRTAITANWAFASATAPANCLGYEVKLTSTNDPEATALQSATISDPTTLTYTFNNLDRETTYYVHVRSNCGNDDGYSTWVSASATTQSLLDCDNPNNVVLVADGTTVNEYVPVYGYYCDSQQKSQSIYPESMLTGLVGKTISKLKYYVESGSSSGWSSSVFNIRMMETTATTLSDFATTTDATLVYNGTLSASTAGGMEINLTTPFTYNGGNLLIEFELATTSSYAHCFFYGISANGASYERYSNNSSPQNFLPKLDFGYCETLEACPAVTVTVPDSTVTTTSAIINWTASTGDYVGSYDLLISDTAVADLTLVTPNYTGLTVTSKTLDTLAEYHDYYVYVRVNCNGYGHDDGNAWSEGVYFQTLSPCNVPKNLNVELRSKRSAMLRWTTTAQTNNYRYFITTNQQEAPSTPTVSGIYGDSVLIENLTPGTTYYLYLSNMCGKALGCSPWIPVTFTTPDACLDPDTVYVSDFDMYQITLNWEPNQYADPTDAYDVYIDTLQVTDFTSVTPTATGVTGTSYTFDTLFRNTLYYMYVRVNCGEAGANNWFEVTQRTDSLAPDCQDQTIADGYNTNNYLPFYGNYMDDSKMRTQFIYDGVSDDENYNYMKPLRGKSINSMKFFTSKSNYNYTATVNVYVGLTSESTLSNGFTSTPSNLVYSGSVSIVNGTVTIPFTSAFDYPLNGGNLIVEFKMVTTGNYSSASFYGVSQSSVTGRCSYGSSNNKQYFLPKVEFNACSEAVACPVIDLVTIPAESVLNDQALITWTRGTGDFTSSYNIIVAPYLVTKPDSTFIQKPAGVVIDSNLVDTFYQAQGLTAETQYYVYVRVNCKEQPYDDGSSNWKLVEPAFTTEKSCVKPFDFQVTGATSTTMSLQWLNRKNASNWELGINDSIVNVALSDDTCRYTVTNLTRNTEYTYTLRTICGVGDTSEMVTLPGGYYQRTLNNETNIRVLDIPYLELIPNTIAQDTLNHTITATVRKGSDLTNVRFEYDRSDYVSKVTSSSGNIQGNYGNLDLTTPATLTVVAEDTLISQDWTMTLTEEACATPYKVAAQNVSRRTADLTWKVGDLTATSFDVVVSTTVLEDPSTGDLNTITTTVGADSTFTYALSGLSRETTYYAYVRTNCGTEYGQWRGTSFTTLAPTGDLCPEVADLTVSAIQATTATITWTATGDYPGTSDIYVGSANDTTGLEPTATGITGTSYTATGLTAYTDYNVYVRTHCTQDTINDGISPWSKTTFKTEDVCEYPRNVVATVTDKTTAHISWTDAQGQVPTDNYEYAYSTEEAEPASGTTSITGSADLTGLTANTTYHIYVRKNCGENQSHWIKANEITMPAAMPAPIIEEVYDLSFNAFKVRWTRDYENYANETQWQYACVASGESPSDWTTTTDTSALVYGRTVSTVYDFYVRAYDGTNNSASAIEEVSTTAQPGDCMTIGSQAIGDVRYPLAYYNYSYSQAIYTPSEIGQEGSITSIKYHRVENQTTALNVNIYMGVKADSTFATTTDWVAENDLTLVDSTGIPTGNANEWVELTLPTPYDYDGTSNLVVAVSAGYNYYSNIPHFYNSVKNGAYLNRSDDDDATVKDHPGTNSGYLDVNHRRPDIIFCFEPQTCPKPTHLVVDNITTTSARATWYPGGTETSWNYYVATEVMTDAELNLAAATNTTTLVNALSGLNADIDYHLYVQGKCSASDSSKWAHAMFTTLPTCSAPINAVAVSNVDGQITFDAAAGTYGTVGSYDYRYWREGTTDTVTVTGQTATYVATNVAGGDYHWQVRANCGTTDGMSRWTTGNDVRVCGEYALPYTQGFEEVPTTYSGPGMIETICWNDLNATVDLSYTPYYNGFTYYYNEGNRSLQLKQGNVDTLYLILPSFGDAENLSVKFDAALSSSASNRIKVGYFTDITDESTFVPVYTAANTNNWTSNAAYIRNLPSGARLAFSYDDCNYGITSAYLDNIRVDTISLLNLATSVSPNANLGTVEITCQATDTTADGRFYEGSTPTLTATANAGFKFTRWSNGETANPLTVYMSQDTNLVANFDTISYNLNVVVSSDPGQYEMGDVTGSGVYKAGSQVTISATDINEHYHVLWSDGSVENPHTITMPAQNTVIIAHFDIDTHSIAAVANVDSMGTFDGTGRYPYGTDTVIRAFPAEHHHFVQWEDGSQLDTMHITVLRDDTVHAEFAIDTHTLTINQNIAEAGSVTGAGVYNYGSQVPVTVTSAPHYLFDSWSDGVTTADRTINLTCDSTITVNFKRDTHLIAVYSNDTTMGIVSGGNRYIHDSTATLSATALEHYHFVSWNTGNTNATFSYVVDQDSSFTATFAIDTHLVTLVRNVDSMGTVQGGGYYDYNSQATLTASPAANHHFVSWSNGDTNSTCFITVLGDTTLTATFAIDSRHFLYTVNDPVRGTATSTLDTGYYDNGTSITLTADSADVHCHFRGWRDLAGNYVSFDNPFTFTLTSDTIVEAEFYVDSLTVTLSVNNDTLGRIVSGAGRYAYNALDTVVAEALTPHARFLGWYQGDNRRSSSLSAKFQMVMDLSLEARFGWDSHEILAASADTVMGTTTGSGTYKHGTTATLTAFPADHYHFVEWSNGDTTETINVFVVSDSSFTATFDSNFYGVTLVAAGDNHGTLTGAGSFKYLSEVTVEAIPADHGVFAQWSNGITANPYTFTLEGDTTITAIFGWDEHTVTAAVNDATMGTTTGSGTYTHGTTATLTATAAEHYHFTGWSNGETTESIEVYVVDDTTLTANFAIDTHTVTLYCDYHVGQVTINGGSSTGRFTYGAEVTIAAVADTQQVFSTWSDGDTHQVRTITVTGDTTLEAYFNLVVYDVTASVNDTAMGYVTGMGRYAYGTMATLRGIAKPHYHFVNWSDGIDVYLHSFMVYGPMHLTATFALDQHEATALVNNTDLGTTTGSGRYDYGTTVTLSATPAAHAVFTGWSNGETANPYTFTLEADTTVTALFIRDQHTVTAATADPAMGTATGTGVYTHGDMATLTAIPATHYHFTQWSTGDTVNPVSLLVEQDETLTAYFAVNQYEVTATVNDPAMGTVAGAGRYDYGTRVTLTALPAANASFVSWSNGATTPSVTITLKGDTTLTATFEMGDHILTATSSDETMGSAEGSGTYRHGTTVLLTATAAAHHHFVKWSNGTTANPATLLLTSDSTVEAIFAIDQHQLAAASADEAMGTVTGAGTYDYGTPVTLTAMPAAHATFMGWSDGTTANPYTFALESDTSLTATFAWDEYTLRVASNDTLMGTVTGSGVYTYGTTATLTATAAEHCHFVKWSNHATTATITVTVESDSMLTAIFAADQYTVAAGVNNTLLGTVAGAGTYDYGTQVTLTATPTAHATFTGWSDGTTANPYTFTLTENTALTANFAWDSHTIAATSNNATMGTVTGAGTYTHGTVATLTATANAHYHLVGWSNGATANVINIYVDQDSTLTATFATDQYTVMAQANNTALGTVTGAGTYDYNATVTLTALPAAHARFTGWSDGSTANPYTFTLTGNTTLTANFALDSHTVTASVNDATMGSVTGAGSYLHGTMATLTATPAAHYHFVNWSNGSTSSVLNFLVENDTAVTASFAADQYTVTTQVNNMTLGTVTGAGTYNYGDTVTLTASPADHAVFQNWSDGSTVNPNTFVLTSDMTFTAYFGMDSHEIVANVNDTLMGTVTGAGTYTHGTMVTLTAVANDHYHFDRWSNGSTESTISIFVEDDSTVTAYFSVDMHRVAVNVNDDDMGYVSGTGVYYYGDTVTLTAIANPHYDFANWSHGDTTPVLTFVVDGDITLQANFAAEVYTVTAQSDNDTMGSVTGSGSYSYGDMVVLIATANAGYHFVSWSDGDTNAVRTFEAEMDVTLTAHFEATVGIREAEAASFIVAGESMRVVVKAAEGEQVWVYDVNGRMLHHTQRAAELETYAVPASGLYLVKVGNYPARRVVVLR